MEGKKPLNLEGLSSMMKRIEEEAEGFSPDLEIVRPDQNQGCTSSSSSPPPSPRSGIEKIDLSSLSVAQLEDKIRDYRNMKLPLKDGGAKIQQRISELERELARRHSQTQPGVEVKAIKNMPLLPNPKIFKGKKDVFDLEIRTSSPEQQVPGCFVEKGYPMIALECDKDESILSLTHTPENDASGIQDLERSPCSKIANVCFKCHQSVLNGTPQSKGTDGLFCCSSCKKKPTSSLANGSVNGMRENRCVSSSAEKSSGSTKRPQQAVGGTFDTALELSDDEELAEVVIGESSSSNLFIRKRLRSASKKLAGAKFLYPSSCDPEAVEVRFGDLQHLAPFEFLNDTVIDFYIKYMQVNFFEEKDGLDRFHFFSCFFYKKLTSAKKAKGKDWFEEVHKWTKGVNLFKKLYLFVPIHDSCHWSLALVCFPGRKLSYILHLDSLASAGHQSNIIYNVLKSYLVAEQKHLIRDNNNVEDMSTDEPFKPAFRRIMVPLQDNEWDCGLFMLYYIQKFVEEVDSKGLDDMFGRNWFKPNEASELRGTIRTILESIFVQEVT